MLTLPSSVRIYVAAEALDLRRGFDGLAAATRSIIGESPLSGHLFADDLMYRVKREAKGFLVESH